MKHTAFRYDFTFRELIYFLFAKKNVPTAAENWTNIKTSKPWMEAFFNHHPTRCSLFRIIKLSDMSIPIPVKIVVDYIR